MEVFLPPAGAADADLEVLVSGPEAARGRFFGFATEGEQLGPRDFECRQRVFFSGFAVPAARLVSRSAADPEGPGLWLEASGDGILLPAAQDSEEVQSLLQSCFASAEFWSGLDLETDPEGPPPALVVRNGIPALKYDLLAGPAEGRLAELLNSGSRGVVWEGVAAELWRAEPGGWPLALRIVLRATAGADLEDLLIGDADGDHWRPADEEGDSLAEAPEEYDLVLLVAGEVYDLNAPDLLREKAAAVGGSGGLSGKSLGLGLVLELLAAVGLKGQGLVLKCEKQVIPVSAGGSRNRSRRREAGRLLPPVVADMPPAAEAALVDVQRVKAQGGALIPAGDDGFGFLAAQVGLLAGVAAQEGGGAGLVAGSGGVGRGIGAFGPLRLGLAEMAGAPGGALLEGRGVHGWLTLSSRP